MQSPDDSWLVGSAVSRGADGPGGATVGILSALQKRELARLAIGAVASTAFFLVPLLHRTAEESLPIAPATLAATASRETIAAAAVQPGTVTPLAHAAPLRSIRTGFRAVPRARMVLTGIALEQTRVAAGAKATSSRVRRSIISRLLVGDGRFRVQPFPTVEYSTAENVPASIGR